MNEVNAYSVASSRYYTASMMSFVTQMAFMLTLLIASLINLSITRERETVWWSVLSFCSAYALPAPRPPRHHTVPNHV